VKLQINHLRMKVTLTFNLSDELVAVNETFSTCEEKTHTRAQTHTHVHEHTNTQKQVVLASVSLRFRWEHRELHAVHQVFRASAGSQFTCLHVSISRFKRLTTRNTDLWHLDQDMIRMKMNQGKKEIKAHHLHKSRRCRWWRTLGC